MSENPTREQLLELNEALRREIDERKRIEQSLKQSEERLATAQRIAHFGNWDWNIVTNELAWSDEIYRIFGLESNDSPTTYEAFLAAVHPDDRDLVKESVRRALEEQVPYHIDHRIVRPSGEVRIVHEHAEVTRDEGDRPVRMIGTVQDVTDSRQAEELVRNSEQLLRNILEALPVGVWLLDETASIVSGNPAGEKIWGGAKYVNIRQFECYKGWWPDSGKQLEPHEWSAARAITKGETVLSEVVEIEAFDGRRKTISNSAVPLITRDGRIRGAIVVAEDITERASFQKALRYSNRLLESSRSELRRLSAHADYRVEEERRLIAQELHDQLGQGLIASKIALHMLTLDKPEHQRLRDQIAQVVSLIDQTIQSVKRIALGLRPFVLDHLGLVAAIESELPKFEEKTGISTVSYLPQDGSVQLTPDVSMTLFRIFEEALSNVRKHARATQLIVRLESEAGRLLLEIHDNGQGIDDEQILAPESLGIAGMRERVNRLGGDLCIENNDCGGTSVVVSVPLNEKVPQ
ncbi:MAG: PAS domain S-box protein [Acidobacteria bacterium]|nr:MAG: PAS domain S-box protein [Acidobacteriota bacterium]